MKSNKIDTNIMPNKLISNALLEFVNDKTSYYRGMWFIQFIFRCSPTNQHVLYMFGITEKVIN